MTLFGILWLLGFGIGSVIVSVMSRREARNLSWLALCFAMNAAFFGLTLPFLNAEGGETFLVVALADWIMALLCMMFWCYGSIRIYCLAAIMGVINFAMLYWYHNPEPYELFVIVNAYIHPIIIRTMEVAQLSVLFWCTPYVQSFKHRQPTVNEPPCQFSMQHR